MTQWIPLLFSLFAIITIIPTLEMKERFDPGCQKVHSATIC